MTDRTVLDVPWWEGPMLAFDTETTGPDPDTARLVSFTTATYTDTWYTGDRRDVLVNPGVPIPDEAVAVHGISTERAEAQGVDPADAVRVAMEDLGRAWASGIPVVAFNAPYDLTVVDREADRHLGLSLVVDGPVIDPLVLDRLVDPYVKGSGQRRLGPTCERYGVDLTEWHDAGADAWAAQALARAIGARFPTLPTDLGDLWRAQVAAYARQATALSQWWASQGVVGADGRPRTADTRWPLRRRIEASVR